jgi:hypothetical protein
MALRSAVLCDIAIREEGNRVRRVDLRGLFRRLLLFETVTVKSVALQDASVLVPAFKRDGLKQLLECDILRFSVEDSSLVTDIQRNNIRDLPAFQFSFGQAKLHNPDQGWKKQLKALEGVPGLCHADRLSLENVIWSKLFRTPPSFIPNVMSQSEEDLRTNKPVLYASVEEVIRKQFGKQSPTFSLRVEEVKPRIFYLVNDLENVLKISQEQAHHILNKAVTGVAEINHRIEDMFVHSAITGFTEDEAPLLFKKMTGVLKSQNPEILEKQLARVVTILGLPEISPQEPVNVENLLKARDSSELREFRDWLYKFEGKEDKEVEKLVRAVGLRLGALLRSSPGKAIRFAATTALGFIPGAGLVLGPVSGAIDTFLVEEMLPTSGVFAFLTGTYPSLFK